MSGHRSSSCIVSCKITHQTHIHSTSVWLREHLWQTLAIVSEVDIPLNAPNSVASIDAFYLAGNCLCFMYRTIDSAFVACHAVRHYIQIGLKLRAKCTAAPQCVRPLRSPCRETVSPLALGLRGGGGSPAENRHKWHKTDARVVRQHSRRGGDHCAGNKMIALRLTAAIYGDTFDAHWMKLCTCVKCT